MSNAASDFLKRQVGPFPVVVWLGIIGAGVGASILIQRATSGGGSDDGDAAPAPDGFVPFIPVGGQVIHVNGAPGDDPPDPETNEQWRRAVLAHLIADGFDPVTASNALAKMLAGQPLNADECAAVHAALTYRLPPEEIPAIDCPTDGLMPINPSDPIAQPSPFIDRWKPTAPGRPGLLLDGQDRAYALPTVPVSDTPGVGTVAVSSDSTPIVARRSPVTSPWTPPPFEVVIPT